MKIMPRTTQRFRLAPTASALMLMCAACNSFAAITCTAPSPSSSNFAYVASTNNGSPGQSGANNVVTNNVSFSCTRTTANPNTFTFGVTNGQQPAGGSNRARNPGPPISNISYNTYKDAGCSQALDDGNTGGRITTTLVGPLNTPETVNIQFYTCVIASQALTSFPAGIYTDTANMNVRYQGGGAAIDKTTPFSVNINAPAVCSILGLPASNTINLSYTAFQNTAAFKSAQFTAQCTNLLPYTMAVSPAAGVVGGVRYQLGLSTGAEGSAGSIGSTPLSDVGGALGTKVHFINASMQAGQAGQAGAPMSSGHTLTITY